MAITKYATIDELKAHLGSNVSATAPGLYEQLTGRTKPHSTGNDDIGNAALDDVAAVMASYLKKAYGSMPITDADALLGLKLCQKRLAHYELALSTPGYEPPASVVKARDDCMEWLAMIASGKVELQSAVKASAGAVTGSDTEQLTEDIRDHLD